MPEIITSKENKRIKELIRIQSHPRPDCFLIEGYHAVEVAYQQGYLKEAYALEDPLLQGVETYLVNEAILKKVSKASTFEKIIGICSLPEHKELSNRVLIFDRLQDPGNIGTLLRASASFGFEDVIFLKGTCSPFNFKAVAASEGALFFVHLHFYEEDETIALLNEQGYCIIGSALRDARPMEGYDYPKGNIALILGNEGQGMSSSLLSKTDVNLKISMEKMESLNVAMAGSILMHDIYTRDR